MAQGTAAGIFRYLTHADPTSDRELLARFAAARDDRAFAELARRHGPLVLSACRRGTRNHHDADDAFQAVFLTLARRAASIQNPDLLGNWLYQVAVRVAWRARRAASRRRVREVLVAEVPESAVTPREPDDLGPVLDEELARLSAWYRDALVLCDLQGLARTDAASRLGIPPGTLASRLDKARKKLAARLTKRGVTLSAAAMPTVLARARAAVLPSALLDRLGGPATGAVLRFAQGGVAMRMATTVGLMTATLALAVAGLTARPGDGQTPTAPPPRPVVPPKDVALRAWDESVAGLKSGVGEGVYEAQFAGGKHARYKVKVAHAGSKFWAELDLLGTDLNEPWVPSTLVVVCDGRTLAYRSSNRGPNLAVLAPATPGNVTTPLFPFYPAQLAPVDLPALVKNRPGLVFAHGPDGVTATDRELKANGITLTLRFPRAVGYNPASFEVRRDDDGSFDVRSVVWDRSNGAWYVKQVERTSDPRILAWRQSEKLTYTRFEANVEIDPSRFRLPILGLARGAPLFYRDADGRDKTYMNDPPAEDYPGDTLLDGLRRLPRRNPANLCE